MLAARTYGNAAGQGGALGLPSRGDVGLHDAVVQQVPRPRVGERGAFELGRVHLVDETGNNEDTKLPPRLWDLPGAALTS